MTKPLKNWEQQHNKRVDAYAAQIERLFQSAMEEAARLAGSVSFNPKKPFSFADYPQTAAKLQTILSDIASNVQILITTGSSSAWDLSNAKNDDLVADVFAGRNTPSKLLDRYRQRNREALAAFQTRKVGGLNLSQRVFKYTGQFKTELELGLDAGLMAGKSAGALARELKKYLQNPDELFRRVRNARGNLVLSRAAEVYNPGRGVYRSSYKNALRLTRTEINGAYRTADFERYNQLDFVVGIEVKRSNNPFPCPICGPLAGKYPKTYKFTGNHPNCRCYTIPILATPEELGDLISKTLAGESTEGFTSENEVRSVPGGFSDYVKANKSRIEKSASRPLFVTDNPTFTKIENKLPLPVPVPVPVLPSINRTKLLEEAGYVITTASEAMLEGLYDKLTPGFDFVAFQSELTGILGTAGIQINKKLFAAEYGQITVNYTGKHSNGGHFELQRSFKLEGGKRVVDHDYFKLPSVAQGGGTSKAVFQALYKQYQAANIERIDVFANIDIGGYTWARYGFGFKTQSDRRMVYNRAVQKFSGKELADFKLFWEDIKDAKVFPLQAVASSKWGKPILLGSNWSGVLDLTDPAQVKVFENYLFGR